MQTIRYLQIFIHLKLLIANCRAYECKRLPNTQYNDSSFIFTVPFLKFACIEVVSACCYAPKHIRTVHKTRVMALYSTIFVS